ncbi:MAG: hypothetical protein D6754_06015 [Alphaproteobacteria bacterium]|nr:MAG: hypothetical protein D6754_06015 [Alphaproteobacteria bacterium]
MWERAKAAGRLPDVLASLFRQREIVLCGGDGEHRLLLTPKRQAIAVATAGLVVAWLGVATGTAIFGLIDSSRTARDIALMREGYETRLAEAEAARKSAEASASAAETELRAALRDYATARAELMQAVEAERSRSVTLSAVRRKLADAIRSRDEALRKRRELESRLAGIEGDLDRTASAENELSETLGTISLALAENIQRREAAERRAAALGDRLAALHAQDKLEAQRLRRMLDRLEGAVEASLGKLEGALTPVGFDVDQVVAQLRQNYSGEGGPFVAMDAAVKTFEDDPHSTRIARLMNEMERLQLLGIAIRQLPLTIPVKNAFRYTSGFGVRRDPINHRVHRHNGIDLAAPYRTPIYATGDGTVIYAGRMRGYGKVIKIRHAFGVETLYAHLSAIRVKKGDRIAQGDRIGDMGNTGRSTGTHLHYEIHVNGTPINPMRYLKAARNVL